MSTTRIRRLATAVLLLAVLAFAAGALAACGSDEGSTAASPSAAGPITVTDDAGNQVALDQPAERVVSIAPADTEIAFAIGGGDKMVGGTTYDDYPEEAKDLAKVGDFGNPSIEKIVALEPDLVLSTGGVQEGVYKRLEKLGVAVFVVDPTTYDGVTESITEVGRLMGLEGGAAEVVADMTAARDDVQGKVASLDEPATFIEVYSKPLMTAGTGTFIDDLVALAGGANIGAAAGPQFPTYSNEVLIQEDPAVYVAMAGSQSTPGSIAKRPGYSGLTAVKDGRVYIIDDNLIARPGPRLADGLRQLAAMIHPEAFPAQ